MESLENSLNKIDNQILQLLKERFELNKQLVESKNLIVNSSDELDLQKKIITNRMSSNIMRKDFIEHIMTEMIFLSKIYMKEQNK